MIPFYYDAKKIIVLLLAGAFFTAGTAVSCQAAEEEAAASALSIQQLAVMPFIKTTSEAQKKETRLEKNLDCQLLGICAVEPEIFPESQEGITALAQAALRRKAGDKVVPMARVREAFDSLAKEATDTPRELAVRLGQSLGVDHVMVGLVWRYRERVGSAMAASDPASVAFSLFMVEVESGTLVWKDSFDKTQTSLTENLLDAPMYLKTGMKWLTAEELSRYGIEKIVKKLSINE